eukprot:6878686-Prymnesium_polylepis.1
MWVPDLGLALRVCPGMTQSSVRGRLLGPRRISPCAALACGLRHAGVAVKRDPPSRLPEVTLPFIRSLTPPVAPSIRIKYHGA